MAYYPATSFVPQFTSDAGVPLSGGSITAYVAGTSTPTAMYIDSAGTSGGTSIALNARGEPTVSGNTVVIWLDTDVSYKFVLKDASAVTKWTVDAISNAQYQIDGDTPATFFITKGLRVVNSIAALAALDKTEFTRAFVTGYYAAGDGGGGIYLEDPSDTTSANNGGTIIVASDGGRWKLFHNDEIWVEQFGAKGDGVTNDLAAIQAAMDYIEDTGRAGIVRLRGDRTYGISAALSQVRGVSLLGMGTPFTYALADNVDGARIKWLGAGSGKMLQQRNRWTGQLKNIIFDGNDLATMGIESIGACEGMYESILVENIAAGSSAWFLTTTGALYPDAVTQWPSCALNTFKNCVIRDVAGNGMVWDGTLDGGNATVGAITQNLLINCRFQGGNNGVGFVLNKCCDTNWSMGGEYTSVSGASGAGVVINYSAVNDETYGNNFYGGVFASSDGTGIGIQCTNNTAHNMVYGGYLSFAGTRVNNVSGTGKVKLVDCSDLSGVTFSAASTPTPGASPWTYTNTDPYAKEFTFWAGTISAVSRVRAGISSGVGTGAATYLLQPGDGITITHSVAPNVLVMPQ